MRSFFEWFDQEENKFFVMHLAFILIFSVLTEALLPIWTKFAFPALLLIAVVSFLVNYPVNAVKEHGLFSEYLIELRILWLVILSVFIQYIIYGLLETSEINLTAAIALLVGLVVLFYARSHLQEKITQARGFK